MNNIISPFQTEQRTEIFRRQSFARHYANGSTLLRALRQAGYENRSESFALDLLSLPEVREEMERTYQVIREKIGMSKEAIIAQLDTDRSFAYEQESPAAAIQATVAKAKILGLLDKTETNRLPSGMEIVWGEASTEQKHSSFIPEKTKT